MTKDIEFVKSGSGAYVAALGDVVVKTGQGRVGERIDDQRDWLLANAGVYVVPVLAYAPGLIVMPFRAAPNYSDGAAAMACTVAALKHGVWNRKPVVINDHLEELYGISLCMDTVGRAFGHAVWEAVLDMVAKIDSASLPRCLTHGDPTWCNTLQDRLGRPVLIDPLPANYRVPDVRAVDLGKLLQSCLGWEREAHGWKFDGHEDWVRGLCEDENEWLAARYWCVVHLARLVPYYPEHREWALNGAQRVCGI